MVSCFARIMKEEICVHIYVYRVDAIGTRYHFWMSKRLCLLVWPDSRVTADFFTPKCLASASMAARFAFPSSGGAETYT